MAQAMVNSQVKLVKGTAAGCHGVIRAAIWLPSGDHMFGIELDEPKGTHNGRYKVEITGAKTCSPLHRGATQDGTPYFSCKKNHGIYMKMNCFIPVGVTTKPHLQRPEMPAADTMNSAADPDVKEA